MKFERLCYRVFVILQLVTRSTQWESNESTPSPTPWPEQFHALLSMSMPGGRHQVTNLWYDWPNGKNINIIQKQLGELLYDVEWNNGTSFYYTLGADGTCKTTSFEVGIPRPNFLDGGNYLGTVSTDGFLCNLWEKVDFIWYYEDVTTKLPVRWDFYDGISTHVITFDVGAVLEDSKIQAPVYCFNQDTQTKNVEDTLHTAYSGGLFRFNLKKAM